MSLIETGVSRASQDDRCSCNLRTLEIIEPKASYNYEKLFEFARASITDVVLQFETNFDERIRDLDLDAAFPLVLLSQLD